jgi:DNA-directed RNA polymerase specialized sigma24 family protein
MEAIGQLAEFMSDERSNHISQIVTRAGQRMMRFIRARVRSDADAEDILQDVWRQLVTAIEDGPIEHVRGRRLQRKLELHTGLAGK